MGRERAENGERGTSPSPEHGEMTYRCMVGYLASEYPHSTMNVVHGIIGGRHVVDMTSVRGAIPEEAEGKEKEEKTWCLPKYGYRSSLWTKFQS